MSAIIKNQYETAKKLLALCEFNLIYLNEFGNTQKDFDILYKNVTSLLTIVGSVYISSMVMQNVRERKVSIIQDCRNRFAAYEAELMQAGIILTEWEQILADVEPTEPADHIEYTDNQKCEMWAEYKSQNNYDYNSRR